MSGEFSNVSEDGKSSYAIAFEQASLKLKATGLTLFSEAMRMADERKDHMHLNGDEIEEHYKGRRINSYVGLNTTDGFFCTCSWFASRSFCRHLIFYRSMRNLPIFDINMFQNCLLAETIEEQRVIEEAEGN